MESGAVTEFLALQEAGLNLPGVSDQGDLTPFQKWALLLGMQKRTEKIQEQESGDDVGTLNSPPVNSARRPHGGGRRVESKKFVNKSVETGKDPAELIQEHQDNGGN